VYPNNIPRESKVNFAEMEQDPSRRSMLSRDLVSMSEVTLLLAEALSEIGAVST